MSKADDNKEKMLEILYDNQRSLLERLQIHQHNLNLLLSQKASVGLDVSLRLHNEIHQQESEINSVKKDLSKIDFEINNLISQSNSHNLNQARTTPEIIAEEVKIEQSKISQESSGIKPQATINGVNYLIEVPFPFLRLETTGSTTGQIYTKSYYAGGFEAHYVTEPNKNDMEFSFYVHGHKVAPILDTQNKKIIVPKGYAVVVAGIIANFRNMLSEEDITPQLISEGRWSVISPSFPKSNIMISDWPQGGSDTIMTSKITYDGGYELWMVQSLKQLFPLTVWFYEQGWNVAPIIDKRRLSLKFPKQPRGSETGGK